MVSVIQSVLVWYSRSGTGYARPQEDEGHKRNGGAAVRCSPVAETNDFKVGMRLFLNHIGYKNDLAFAV